MAFQTFTFDLELQPGGAPPVIYASAGDIGRPFQADLYWNGEVWTATGTTAKIRGKKPDKTVFDYSATVDGSSVTFSTTEQMTIISGPVECELVFTLDSSIVATANFVLVVEESPFDANAISESEVTGLNAMIQAATPEAVADWFDESASSSTVFTNAVNTATDTYLDENGVEVRLSSIIKPDIDDYFNTQTFDYYCTMKKGTVGATVTDGTRWRTNGAVRIDRFDNLLFTLNSGYKAMIYCYNSSWAQISGRPQDSTGNGWLVTEGVHRLTENYNVTDTHRNDTIAVVVVIAAANGTDVITEEQATAAFSLSHVATNPLEKVGVAELTTNNRYMFKVPVELNAKERVQIYLKSDAETSLLSGSELIVGDATTSIVGRVNSQSVEGADLQNGLFTSLMAENACSGYIYLYAGNETPANVSVYIAQQADAMLDDKQFATAVPDAVVVAAYNSSGRYARMCDFFCDGVNDEVELQAAVSQAISNGRHSGNILLLGGDYYIDSFASYDTTVADRPTAVLINPASTNGVVNIEGAIGENSTVIHVSADGMDEAGEQVALFALNVRNQNTAIVNYKNLRVVVADQTHPLICFDNFYAGACKMESVRMYATGYGAGQMPVAGLIGVKCSRGNPNGIGQEMRHVGATGFYEGFQMGGEHLVAIECLGRNCYYSYTFGNYPYSVGVMEHPLTLINCCDELSAALPLFNRNGQHDNFNNPGLQQVDFIGFNIESRPSENPTLADLIPATETVPGSFCGRCEFVVNKLSSSTGNAKDFTFWADGSGERFRTSNMTHKLGGTTTERNTYTPQYMQTYYDTDLNKMLVYDGTAWVDCNGQTV